MINFSQFVLIRFQKSNKSNKMKRKDLEDLEDFSAQADSKCPIVNIRVYNPVVALFIALQMLIFKAVGLQIRPNREEDYMETNWH